MCMYACTYACCMYTGMHMNIEDWTDCYSQKHLYPFEIRSSTAWNLLCRLDWLATKPMHFSHICLHDTRIWIGQQHIWFHIYIYIYTHIYVYTYVCINTNTHIWILKINSRIILLRKALLDTILVVYIF